MEERLSRSEASELLGVLALDACDADEAAAIEQALVEYPDLREELDQLRFAAAALADLAEEAPPPGLFERVRAAANQSTKQSTKQQRGRPQDLYRELQGQLTATLADLAPRQWGLTAWRTWTVQDMVAHLAAVDGVLRSWLAGAAGQEDFPAALEAATEALQVESRSAGPAATQRRWQETASALADELASWPEDATVPWLGIQLPAADALVERSFELWVHLNDVRAAVGLAPVDPSPEHFHLMGDLGARLMPLAMAGAGRGASGTLRIELDGPGGGMWTVALEPGATVGERPDVLFRASLREMCELIGDRRPPEQLHYEVSGAHPQARRIAADLVAAAPGLARP